MNDKVTELTINKAKQINSLSDDVVDLSRLVRFTNCEIIRRKVLSRHMCLVTLSQHDEECYLTSCFKRVNNDDENGVEEWSELTLQNIPAVGSIITVVGWLERKKSDIALLCSQFPEILQITEGTRNQVGKGNLTGTEERRAICKSEWSFLIGKSKIGCQTPDNCKYRHDLRGNEGIRAEELRISNEQHGELNSKKERFKILADFLINNIGLNTLRSSPVLDVAGGKGYLGIHLGSNDNHIETIVVDPADKNRSTKGRAKLTAARVKKINEILNFDDLSNLPETISCIVGLHPDEATDLVVKLALKYKTAFAVVPCCVFPSKFPERILNDGTSVVTTDQLLTYLTELCARNGVKTAQVQLPFEGKNKILYSLGKTTTDKDDNNVPN